QLWHSCLVMWIFDLPRALSPVGRLHQQHTTIPVWFDYVIIVHMKNLLKFFFSYLRARTEVKTRTSWNAPIVWELMFNPDLYDRRHQEAKTTVALTVFAVGRYLDAYLNTFLTSAEKHFMVGLPVTFYVFTDQPEKVPNITLAPLRHLNVIKVERYSRRQDISMMRMKTVLDIIEKELRHNFNYVFCLDEDQELKRRLGSEALGESVAVLHVYYYKLPKTQFTYDRNPKCKAYMTEGDYYYHAAVFGGSCDAVKALVDYCYLSTMEDKLNDVEALWHDESHLNKYFWLNRPMPTVIVEQCDHNIFDKFYTKKLTFMFSVATQKVNM
uniref:Alpha 1,3-galactosyltransferase 2 n=1 Tax=Oryzias latipes TaxID=8090 RepID=H2L5L3_ORYLA